MGGTAHSFSIDHVHEDELASAGGGVGEDTNNGGEGESTIYSLVCQASSDTVRDEWITAIRQSLERTHKFKIVLLGEVSQYGRKEVVMIFKTIASGLQREMMMPSDDAYLSSVSLSLIDELWKHSVSPAHTKMQCTDTQLLLLSC